MRDIQQVLERWGAWVACNPEKITWYPVAAGFKGLFPDKVTSRPQCCDEDGLIVSKCVAKLQLKNVDLHDLLVDYYILGHTFMSLARKHHCSDGHIGKKLQKAEGVIEGMLVMLDASLEMDRYVQYSPHPYQRETTLRT
ncbi:antiterminator Q family protein [Pantoea brenneri]|uniref:antiterminator Q family protein n=1 Tax=Pantoea brenneri TaxID=472694 RepID=UPI00244A5DE3|nr:antiterminator Q family protein [Pantoea brenneri]MDH1086338.1 antiterminator Q family protein [Pantoea brenneri]